MVTFTNQRGITLSASATLNGFPLPARVLRSVGAGDFANSDAGRARRNDRRNKAAQRAFFAGL